jgi:RHS repeat-associated protein
VIWNGSGLVGASQGATQVYVHGARVDEIVFSANFNTGQFAYHHYDANGNCTLLTGSGGAIVEQYEYDAFGYPYFFNASGANIGYSPWNNRFLFTGREYLSDLKLYDYRNRMYQPELGRFMQPDPKEFAAGDYNLYRYCHNDPVNKSDPFGLLEYRFAKNYPDKGPGRREVVVHAIEKELKRSEEGRKILDAKGVVTIHPVDPEHPKTQTTFYLNPKLKDFDTYLDPTNSRFQDAATFRALSKHPGELPQDSDKGRAAIIGHEFAHGVFKVRDEIRTIREHENIIRDNLELPLRRSSGGDPFHP